MLYSKVLLYLVTLTNNRQTEALNVSVTPFFCVKPLQIKNSMHNLACYQSLQLAFIYCATNKLVLKNTKL